MRSSRVSRAGKAPRGKGLVSAAAPSRIAPPGLDSTSLPCSQAIWDAAVAHSPPPACLDPGFSRGQLPICLPQEAGNEFHVLLRWHAKPLLSPISSYCASDSLVTPQGREPWPEEATPSSSHACPWAGRAGRAVILAPPGCLVCHSLPSSGRVRSDPGRDVENPGHSPSGRASAMQLAWLPPSPSHCSPWAGPSPRGPTTGTKLCFSLSPRTWGSCQDTTLLRCQKSYSLTSGYLLQGAWH